MNQDDGHSARGSAQSQAVAAADEIKKLRMALAASEARERTIANALQHRVRNLIAVVRSIFRYSRESDVSQDEFAGHFEGRLNAVVRYLTQLDQTSLPGVELEDMLRGELLEYHCLDGASCTLIGPPVHFRQHSIELMGLAIHELVTNSVKFGALAQGGRLIVQWSLEEGPQDALLHFHWTESGVSVAAAAPRPTGFGRRLIEETLPYQLGATTSFRLNPGGIECTILLPVTL